MLMMRTTTTIVMVVVVCRAMLMMRVMIVMVALVVVVVVCNWKIVLNEIRENMIFGVGLVVEEANVRAELTMMVRTTSVMMVMKEEV